MTLSVSKNILTYSGSLSPPFSINVTPPNPTNLVSYSPTTFTIPYAVYNQASLYGSLVVFSLFKDGDLVSNEVVIYAPLPGIPITGINFLLPQ